MKRRGRRSLLANAAAAVCAALWANGCARPASPHPPIVLVSIDTLRADHLPAYGYRGVATPAIDALRKDAILYENAYAQVPLTLPSHASLLTGLLPFENGVRDNAGFRLDPRHPTLAGIAKSAGYATGAAVSSFALRRDRGLAAGFDFYDDDFAAGSPDERAGTETAAALERWLDGVLAADSPPPVFLFLHVYEPHTPYAPPEPFRTRYAVNPYDGEIATADAAVGGFLDVLRKRRLYDRAAIVLLSDHGEGLNDHGEAEHGVFLYRESIRVPLIVKLPDSRDAGRTVRRPVALVDVFPTLAGLMGAPSPPSRSAASAASLLDDARADPARRIYSETLYPRLQLGWSDLASLTDARYQYIEAPRPELYDLESDPGERKDLSAEKSPAFRSLRLALEKFSRPAASPEKSTPEEIEKLGSLGYIRMAAGASGKNLPDPKDRVAALAKYKELFALFYARRDVEAAGLAREILSSEPRILSVSRVLAVSLERLGKAGEGARALQAALARPDPGGTPEDRSQAYAQLAGLWQKAGDTTAAERALREAVSRDLADDEIRRRLARLLLDAGRAAESLEVLPLPGSADTAETLDLRGSALADAGRLADARTAFRSALARDPRNASALFHLGMLSLKENDAASAREWLEKSLAAEPRAPATLAALGLAQASLKDERGAMDSWTKAIALDPKQYQALFNRSVLAGRRGDRDEARQGLARFLATAPADRFARERGEAKRLLKHLGGG